MFKVDHRFSAVSAILPVNRAPDVIAALTDLGLGAFGWKARGTLLQDQWFKRFLPPVSPNKTMLHTLVQDTEVNQVVDLLVERGRLHQQATGAVFALPCEHAYFGSEFVQYPQVDNTSPGTLQREQTQSLSAIYCIVEHRHGERVAKAAINAGAHGPIVYYAEGHGIRDRLGWLRITKEHEKEVLVVIADESDVEEVFDAMALAAEIYRPGRGFMYRVPIERGLFNLPSRVSHHHYEANMQQIIRAIDHLAGHNHWRDESAQNVGVEGRGIETDLPERPGAQRDQVAVSSLVRGDELQTLTDMLLDSGAPGVNIHRGSFLQTVTESNARIRQDYGLVRCICDRTTAENLCAVIDANAEGLGMTDLAVVTHAVPRTATYQPGRKNHRRQAVA